MTPVRSSPSLLTLHGLRLAGMGDARAVSRRFGLPRADVDELLLDFEAYGWVRRTDFAEESTWTLTDAGRDQGERFLAEELRASGAKAVVERVHEEFLPLNAALQRACTAWQIRPLPGAPLAANDHTDFRWDDRVIADLASLGRRVRPLAEDLAACLTRFGGYADRYGAAITRVERGERSWVDGLGIDSAHAVWFELHEDLIATLGLERG